MPDVLPECTVEDPSRVASPSLLNLGYATARRWQGNIPDRHLLEPDASDRNSALTSFMSTTYVEQELVARRVLLVVSRTRRPYGVSRWPGGIVPGRDVLRSDEVWWDTRMGNA